MRMMVIAVAMMLMLGVSPGALASNIVSNPGFETGNFTGWTQFGNTGFTDVSECCAHSGTFGAFFGPVSSTGGIVQTLSVDANSTYNIDFWLRNEGGSPNSFEVLFDGVPVYSVADQGSFDYTHIFTSGATDNDGTAELRIVTRHDPSFWNLDDICVDNARNGECTTATQVTAPASLALLGLGVAGLGLLRRRKA